MNIAKSTSVYEDWLAKSLHLLPAGLARKHKAMRHDPFSFFRATFYRWMQLWPEVCPDAHNAPEILAVGDLHVENFGTWRDSEGRLVWGVNDFDEAFPLPYTIDLVRLATSAHLAIATANLSLDRKDACEAILEGYRAGLKAGGKPFILAEENTWLRRMVTSSLRDPVRFWTKLHALTAVSKVPSEAKKSLQSLLPVPLSKCRVAHRVAGLGSLGRERYVALAEWEGASIAREAKALAPSACVWAFGGKRRTLRYQDMLDGSVRSVDPYVKLKTSWIVRRLAPDCSRIDLTSMPSARDEENLLQAMGFETANIHLGSRGAARRLEKDLARRTGGWLHRAADDMTQAVNADWKRYRETI